jgi:hypothetical protein
MIDDDHLPWGPSWALGWGLHSNGSLASFPFEEPVAGSQAQTAKTALPYDQYKHATHLVHDKRSYAQLLNTLTSASAHFDAGYVKGDISTEASFLKQNCSNLDEVHFTVSSKVMFEPVAFNNGKQPQLTEAVSCPVCTLHFSECSMSMQRSVLQHAHCFCALCLDSIV